MSEYVIGCDIGSQSLKAILVAEDGRLCGEVSVSYPIQYPHPTWAEQPAGAWISALEGAVRAVLSDCGVSRESVRGIGLASQLDGVVAIDSAGKPLRPALIWMDRRAVAQCQRVEQRLDPKYIANLTGLNLDATHVAPKIRWLLDNEPGLMEAAEYFLLQGSYVAYCLTGELAVDYSNASSTLLLDVRKRAWSQEMCDLFGVPLEKLVPVLPATQVLGRLLPDLAERMGLNPSTQVILGSGDEQAACLGAGVIRPGLVIDIAGTAEPVGAASQVPKFDPTGLVETHCHAHPSLWFLENPGFASGANYRWFKDHFAAQEVLAASSGAPNPYDQLNELAATVPPGSEGLILLPCLMGAMAPTWNALARGTYFGFTLAHTRAHFVRALLEGSAYAVRDITDQMRAMGIPLEQMQVVAGGAKSALWRQIKADVTGLPVALPQTTETTALGAAMMAMVGVGMVASLEEAAGLVVRIIETREPDPHTQAQYEPYYQLYRATYSALLPVFEQAARISPPV